MAAEKDRLAALDCWDITTPNILTIGHVYMKVRYGNSIEINTHSCCFHDSSHDPIIIGGIV